MQLLVNFRSVCSTQLKVMRRFKNSEFHHNIHNQEDYKLKPNQLTLSDFIMEILLEMIMSYFKYKILLINLHLQLRLMVFVVYGRKKLLEISLMVWDYGANVHLIQLIYFIISTLQQVFQELQGIKCLLSHQMRWHQTQISYGQLLKL